MSKLSNYSAMMKKGKLMAMIVLFVVVLTSGRMMWIDLFMSDEPILAVNGELDLRTWDASSNRTTTLDGQWEFYPNVFLMDGDTEQLRLENAMNIIQVPGNWSASLPEDNSEPFGYGSYRLRLLVDPNDHITYSIRIPSVRSSSAVFVNGRLLGQSGQPATNVDDYTGRNVPYSVSFIADEMSEIEIVIQAANFTDPRKSGIVRSMKFGTDGAIQRETLLSTAMQLMIAAIFMIHAIYALVLYFMGTRDKRMIYFSMLIISANLLLLLANDEKLLHSWFSIDFEWSFKLIFLFVLIAAYSLLQSIIHLLPTYWRTIIIRGYTVLSAVTMYLGLLLPTKNLLEIFNISITISLTLIIMAMVTIARVQHLKGLRITSYCCSLLSLL